jgi:hypothetical protein
MGGIDYTLATMHQLKKDLMRVDDPNIDVNWARGGIIVTLVSQLIIIADEVMQESIKSGEGNAREDLTEIRGSFDSFMEQMLANTTSS